MREVKGYCKTCNRDVALDHWPCLTSGCPSTMTWIAPELNLLITETKEDVFKASDQIELPFNPTPNPFAYKEAEQAQMDREEEIRTTAFASGYEAALEAKHEETAKVSDADGYHIVLNLLEAGQKRGERKARQQIYCLALVFFMIDLAIRHFFNL
jgi:hypothetical protein